MNESKSQKRNIVINVSERGKKEKKKNGPKWRSFNGELMLQPPPIFNAPTSSFTQYQRIKRKVIFEP